MLRETVGWGGIRGPMGLGLGCQVKELRPRECQENNLGNFGQPGKGASRCVVWACVPQQNLSSPSCEDPKMPPRVLFSCNYLLIVLGQAPLHTQTNPSRLVL